MPDADPVTKEAYPHELISTGFWFGEDDTVPEPAFYSYTYPASDRLGTQRLIPEMCSRRRCEARRWASGWQDASANT